MIECRFNKRLINYLFLAIALFSQANAPVVYAKEPAQPTTPTVQELIISYSHKYGVDPRLALAIAYAESRFKNVPNFMYDGESGLYSAYGIFQTTRTFWKHYCTPDKSERMDIEKNIECSVRVISEGGLSNWSESESSWQTTKNHPIEWFLAPNEGQKI